MTVMTMLIALTPLEATTVSATLDLRVMVSIVQVCTGIMQVKEYGH